MPWRSLSGHLEQVSPQAHLVQGTGAVVFLCPQPLPCSNMLGKHCGPQCSQGSPKYHKAGRARRGRDGKQLSLDQHEDARPVPTLHSVPHLHTAFSQRWHEKPEATLKLFPFRVSVSQMSCPPRFTPGLPPNRSVLLKSPPWLPAFLC